MEKSTRFLLNKFKRQLNLKFKTNAAMLETRQGN